jgi:hypothetical protein
MAPGMLTLPFVMRALEKKHWFKSRPMIHAPFQVRFITILTLIQWHWQIAYVHNYAQLREESFVVIYNVKYIFRLWLSAVS